MTRDEAKKYFLKGYERGLRDMIADVLRLAARGYGPTEMSVVLRSKQTSLSSAVDSMGRRVEAGEVDVGVDAPTLGALKGRGSYLIREAKGERVFEFLRELAAGGSRPLCISRMHPGDLATQYGVEPENVVWLSRQGAKGVRSASPTDLVALTSAIHRHLGGGNAVVAVEGLEYLVTQNGFHAILRFVQTIHEKALVNESYLLMSGNPDAFKNADYRQLAHAVTAEL